MTATIPQNDDLRVQALHDYGVMDSSPEPIFDDISDIAAEICEAPAAYISFIDETRQWLKSLKALPISMCEMPRDVAICNTTICHGDLLVVTDLQSDERFRGYPIVTGAPFLRFYCGAPLINAQGHALGSLCVVDFVPRELRSAKREALRLLANQVVSQLEMRRHVDNVRKARKEMEAEKARADQMMRNIMPATVARELKSLPEGQVPEPKFYNSATVLFTDFKGFTKLSEGIDPRQLVGTLDQFFTAFDEVANTNRLEKLKTIGDAYMCAGGLPESNRTHPMDAALAALQMRAFTQRLNTSRLKLRLPPWEVRIGIHTGAVIAGIVGRQKFAYDVWGNAVNVAARMEQSGEAGKINVSAESYGHMKTLFEFIPRGAVEAKNKGPLEMYFLERILPEFSADAAGTIPNGQFWEEARKYGRG